MVYNLENKSRLQWLKGHENHVSVVKFNSDSSKLVSGSLDGCVMVWNWKETELPLLVLKGHKGKVTSLSLSDDNCRLFSGSFDGTVRIWDLITGHLLREINYGTEVECISSCAQQMS